MKKYHEKMCKYCAKKIYVVDLPEHIVNMHKKDLLKTKIEKDMHLVYTADLDVLCKYGAHKSPKEEKKINLITGW